MHRHSSPASGGDTRIFRVGIGTDRHRLGPGRRLMLGGVHIPFELGEAGHSDGDVLLHAIIDALLGAACMGDIGELFSPGDPRWKNADSANLLRDAWARVQGAGWRIENLDCVVQLEKPKLLPWRGQIIASISRILSLPLPSSYAGTTEADGSGASDGGGTGSPETGSGDIGIPRVFVKAKTAEGLGDVGESRAVDAQVVCLLSRKV